MEETKFRRCEMFDKALRFTTLVILCAFAGVFVFGAIVAHNFLFGIIAGFLVLSAVSLSMCFDSMDD